MINLLQETIQTIRLNNKTIDDVLYVQSAIKEFKTTWPIFQSFAKSLNYDNKCNELNPTIVYDLKVIFKDNSALERESTDTKEYWIYNHYQSNPTDLELSSISQLKNSENDLY